MAARKLGLGSCDWGRWELEGGVANAASLPCGPVDGNKQGQGTLQALGRGCPVHFGALLLWKRGAVPLLTFSNRRKGRSSSQGSARLCRENLYHCCQIHHNSLVLPYIFLNVTEYSAVIN